MGNLGVNKLKLSKTLYQKREWKELRQAAIEHAGEQCESCSRHQNNGAILQLHHDKYISGRKPWEYSFEELTVLCKSCHAELHNEIMATSNWNLDGEENDLGSLDGICDFCGTELRFQHFLSHENWGTLTVGTNCADFLTETKEATIQRKTMERRARFIDPKKWSKTESGTIERKKHRFAISLQTKGEGVFVVINKKNGKTVFRSLEEAKEHLLKKFESGEIDDYFKKIKV